MKYSCLTCNRFHPSLKSIFKRLCILGCLALTTAVCSQGQTDLSSQYHWKPVRIGGGGFVVGMVLHPLDATVRYARTDVGSPYRWDNTAQEWYSMRVYNADGSGVQQPSDTDAPSGYGTDSIAVDPTNTSIVYMVFPTEHSSDIQTPTNYVEIYKSVDGGKNFTPGNMTASAIIGNPNGPNRADGEKLEADPGNPAVLYYGSDSQGLWRTEDDGITWTQFSGATAPPINVEFINIQFAKGPGTVNVNGVVVSKTVYAISVNNSGDAGGDVYQSQDGGQTWTDISTGVMDTTSGEKLSQQAVSSSIDTTDALYVVENPGTNGGHRAYWKYAAGKWTRFSLEGFINQPLTSVAADPTNPQRIYALGEDTSMARSDNGGATWINLGPAEYANTLGWLPQTVGMNGGSWRSNGGLKLDSAGNVWTPTGQEGTLTMTEATASSATTANPPKWTISSKGIEEMVSMDITDPPGSNDTIIATAMDTTGFTIPNPDNFSAVQIPLQQEIISQGTTVAYAPDVPSYIAITTSNVATNGPNYSGYSTDGGKSWTKFGAALKFTCGSSTCDIPAGMIAVGVRGSRALGSDHIVLYPPENLAPEYSQDGGATWHVTSSFPLNADGMTINIVNNDYYSFTYPELNQHLLQADPFTADKFYLKFTHAPFMLYTSTDGGQTWQGQANANLPDYAWQGQLVVNGKVPNDLWYADGWAGSTVHGVFHSTDGGQTFQQIPGISHAITIAVGAGSGKIGDAPYSVYVYGLLTSDPAWGIFQSTDGGTTWNRVSYYPTGIYDTPRAMAASQDTFGKIYVGFSGNSFAYGQYVPTGPQPPAAPAGLSATVASSTEIDLSWAAPAGGVTGYNVYRGTKSGGESTTPEASGVTGTTYADTTVATGTTYYYEVTAANGNGEGPVSNEASAMAAPPSIALAAASGSSTSATVAQGQTAQYSLTLTSTDYNGTISFTCTGAPSGATCTVPSPMNITPATTTTAVSISVQTASATSSLAKEHFRGLLPPLAAGLLILPFFLKLKRRGAILAILAAVTMLVAPSGCGSSSGNNTTPPPPPVVATLTVSASGTGVTTASQTLTLTVDQ